VRTPTFPNLLSLYCKTCVFFKLAPITFLFKVMSLLRFKCSSFVGNRCLRVPVTKTILVSQCEVVFCYVDGLNPRGRYVILPLLSFTKPCWAVWAVCHIQANAWVSFNHLNAKLNPTCHLLALLEVEAHHFLHFSKVRVKAPLNVCESCCFQLKLGYPKVV
jgi:hypothetical protein